MADRIGLLPLPAPRVAPNVAPPGDPMLAVLGDFIQRIANENLDAVWSTPGVGGGPFIKRVAFFDPTENGGTAFNSALLPALFLWREKFAETIWKATDYYLSPSTVHALWIPPKADYPVRAARSNLMTPLHGALTIALERFYGDLTWQDPADDSGAKVGTYGSVVPVRLGVYQIDIGEMKKATLLIESLTGSGEKWPGIAWSYSVLENIAPDMDKRYPVKHAGLALTAKLQGTLTVNTLDVALRVAALTPATGGAAGGDAVSVQGTDFDPSVAVTVGGVAAAVTWLGPAQILIVTPAHAAGAVDVVATNPSGETVTAAGAFTYT